MNDQPEKYAEEVCNCLLKDFPDLEIQHAAPEDYFDGFFCDAGMPMGPEHYPIHLELGRVIHLEATGFHHFNHSKLVFEKAEKVGEFHFVPLFVHEDGFIAVVDDYYGHMHRLFETPNPEVLSEYLRLYFDEGREELGRKSDQPAKLERLLVPFFQFPDDFTTDYGKLPLVPFDQIKELIDAHLKDSHPWLLVMEDLQPQINELGEKIEKQPRNFERTDFTPAQYDPEDEDKISVNGWEFAAGLLIHENERRENERPQLIRQSRQLPEDAFTRWDTNPNLLQWSFPYYHLGGKLDWPPLYFPFALDLGGPVFRKSFEKNINPSLYIQLFDAIKQLFWGDPDYKLPIELKVPDYLEQVETAFIQECAIYKAPILVAEIMDNKEKNTDNHLDRLKERMEAWEKLQALRKRLPDS